jgi:propanediol dehydratase large subunit
MRSPYDAEPSLVVRDGSVVELDGKAAEDFDVIDEFIARYGLDLEAAGEAMALDDASTRARFTTWPSSPGNSPIPPPLR